MTKRTPIELVAKLAKSREDSAARKMTDAQDTHKQATNQLDQIQGYKNEYSAHFDALSRRGGLDGRTLGEYRRFLTDLDDAIDQQNSRVAESGEKVGDRRVEWLGEYRRKSALEQLVDTQKQAVKKADDKKQQKELDEIAGKAARSRYS